MQSFQFANFHMHFLQKLERFFKHLFFTVLVGKLWSNQFLYKKKLEKNYKRDQLQNFCKMLKKLIREKRKMKFNKNFCMIIRVLICTTYRKVKELNLFLNIWQILQSNLLWDGSQPYGRPQIVMVLCSAITIIRVIQCNTVIWLRVIFIIFSL